MAPSLCSPRDTSCCPSPAFPEQQSPFSAWLRAAHPAVTPSLCLGSDNLGCLGGDVDATPHKTHLCSPHSFQKTIPESGRALKK